MTAQERRAIRRACETARVLAIKLTREADDTRDDYGHAHPVTAALAAEARRVWRSLARLVAP